MQTDWYALRTQPNKEEVAWRLLVSGGFEVFYPRLRVNPVNPRSRHVRPYFPGYMFVSAELETIGLSVFSHMPHVHGLVCFGGEAARVPESLIASLRRRVHDVALAGGELFDGLKHGDHVLIREGPFEGYEALFDRRITGQDRVRVLLEFLSGYQVPLELSSSLLTRAKASTS